MEILTFVNPEGYTKLSRDLTPTVPTIGHQSLVDYENFHPVIFTPVEMLTGKV